MTNKDQEKRFLLRLNQKLYEKLQSEADDQGRSVNAHIVNILDKKNAPATFEKRQIIGKVISGADLSDNGLVLVTGIYYRYLLDDNGNVDAGGQYAIIEANGNILTLRKI
jgi:hypothetical protein